MEPQRATPSFYRLQSWLWLSREQEKELRRCRKRLARRLRRHVRPIVKLHVAREAAEKVGPEAGTDPSAMRALIAAECDAAAMALGDAWLREIEHCFARLRGQDPQFVLHPSNLDGAMLPVRSLSAAWRQNRLIEEYGASDEQARAALKAARAALPKGEAPFPPEALRYFEILGCFICRGSFFQ